MPNAALAANAPVRPVGNGAFFAIPKRMAGALREMERDGSGALSSETSSSVEVGDNGAGRSHRHRILQSVIER